jgi:hypothetical protein
MYDSRPMLAELLWNWISAAVTSHEHPRLAQGLKEVVLCLEVVDWLSTVVGECQYVLPWLDVHLPAQVWGMGVKGCVDGEQKQRSAWGRVWCRLRRRVRMAPWHELASSIAAVPSGKSPLSPDCKLRPRNHPSPKSSSRSMSSMRSPRPSVSSSGLRAWNSSTRIGQRKIANHCRPDSTIAAGVRIYIEAKEGKENPRTNDLKNVSRAGVCCVASRSHDESGEELEELRKEKSSPCRCGFIAGSYQPSTRLAFMSGVGENLAERQCVCEGVSRARR